MFVKSKDQVLVIGGADKKTRAKVLSVHPKTGKIVVEGVAMVKKHQKPRRQGQPGGIINKEAAIDASNVMVICPKCKAPTRVARSISYNEVDGKQKRVSMRKCKKCQAEFE